MAGFDEDFVIQLIAQSDKYVCSGCRGRGATLSCGGIQKAKSRKWTEAAKGPEPCRARWHLPCALRLRGTDAAAGASCKLVPECYLTTAGRVLPLLPWNLHWARKKVQAIFSTFGRL